MSLCVLFSTILSNQTFYDPYLLMPSFTLHYVCLDFILNAPISTASIYYGMASWLTQLHTYIYKYVYCIHTFLIENWDASIHANNKFMLTIRTISEQFKISQYNHMYECVRVFCERRNTLNAFGEANHHWKIHFFFQYLNNVYVEWRLLLFTKYMSLAESTLCMMFTYEY